MIWFTSDWHLGHKNIIEYAQRPFKSLEDMNKSIIRNFNEKAKEGDIVIFLGDFCFKNSNNARGEGDLKKAIDYLKEIKPNVHFTFIKGNHDAHNSLPSIIEKAVISFGGKKIFCTHKPEDYNPKYRINIVGHIHEKWKVKKEKGSYLVNVGVDVWHFRPVTINEILKAVEQFKKNEKS